MKLASALRIGGGEVVAFVGGGGKTTAMFRLADEIVGDRGRVLTTTTTRIFAAQTRLAPAHVQSVDDLGSAFARSPHVLLTGKLDPEQGKAFGVLAETICSLQSLVTNILIEADGSRMRPFKAPAEHEPVIPACASVVVPVAGIDAIGKPLNADFVHRPDLVTRIYPGQTVTPEMVAAVLTDPRGGRKNVPPEARFIPLINKVENDEQHVIAEQLAGLMLQLPGVEEVIIGAVARRDNPVWGVLRRAD